MTAIHASLDACNRFAPTPERSPVDAIYALRDAATDLAARLVAGFRHRQTIRAIARFSGSRLHDVGFERDWDGAVIPIVKEQAH